jgi:cobaltochelatase CobN
MTATFTYKNGTAAKKADIVYISVANKNSMALGTVCKDLNVENVSPNVTCADSEDLDDSEEEFIKLTTRVRNCDMVFLLCHGDPSFFKKYDRLKNIIDSKKIKMFYSAALDELNDENFPLFGFPRKEYDLITTLFTMGGDDNLRSILYWTCKNIAKCDAEVPAPIKQRAEGLYRKGAPEDIGLEDYIKDFCDEKPTVGVMFHHTTYSKGKIDPIDDLICLLEKQGCDVIAFYFNSYPDPILGSLGVKKCVEKYFMPKGKKIVDSVILTTGFSQINLSDPLAYSEGRTIENFFLKLGVPLIQAPSVSRSEKKWRDDITGLNASELSTGVIWPEFDGQIISVPSSFTESLGNGRYRSTSVPDRTERVATLAKGWAELSRKPASKRRIAILFHMYPPSNDHLGGAAGLDTFASVCNCLQHMNAEGYRIDRVPDDGKEILDELLAGITTDLRWTPESEWAERAADLIDKKDYDKWWAGLTDKAREGIIHGWGDPIGTVMNCDGRILVPGVYNGNIFIGIQPNRGQHEQAERLYHDPFIVMPHAYLAYYRWLKYVFKADCIVHVGTHGTIEWLPGKGNALSSDCYPDAVLDTMPNVYPYIVDDPGEGIQCKRRTNSVLIGHMCPVMTRADGYDDIALLDGKLQELMNVTTTDQEGQINVLKEDIKEIVDRMELYKEVGLPEGCTSDDILEKAPEIYDYISDLKDALIKDGLHILGQVPKGDLMTEMLYSLSRLKNGEIPSVRASIASAWGLDMDVLLDNPSEKGKDGILNGVWISKVDEAFTGLLSEMKDVSCEEDRSMEITKKIVGKMTDDLKDSIGYICRHTYPAICKMTDEIDNYMLGIGGKYVPTGPSGCPTRGSAHLLPTGTNFYSIDPDAIPTRASWKIGKQMADDMIDKYVKDNGKYPESLGIIVWATDVMSTQGDDVAYILHLMGVRPVYGSVGGKVVGIEVVPIEELGRPRIDVLSRISGLFRDSFPNLVDMIHHAAEIIADLDETADENFLKKHLKDDIQKYISEGMSKEDAKDHALIRVFGDPPLQFGTGVEVLIQSSKWDTLDQIADTFTTWGAYAYGGKWKGNKVPEQFKRRTGALDVTVKNHTSREFDLLDIDDDYSHLGGLNAAVRVYGGDKPYSVMGDSSDVDRLKTRTLEEETAYVMRSRVLNPKWLEGLKRHGFKGVQELSKLTEYMLGWGATSDSIEDWMYDAVTEKFILDEDTRKWMEENNPYALREMIEDMIECSDRDLWNASEDTLAQLRELYLEAEGELEELGSKKP